MRTLFLLMLMLMLTLFFSNAASATVIWETKVRIPFGDSQLSSPLPVTQKISPFQVQYEKSSSCEGFSVVVYTQFKDEFVWTPAVYSNGYFYTADRPVFAVFFKIQQFSRGYQDCHFMIDSPNGQPPPGTGPSTEVITLGATLDYPGGIAQRVIPLDQPFYAQKIEILIPTFCVGVTTTDVAVLRRGQSNIADRVPGKFEIFRLDRPRVFDGVAVGLKGPVTSSCTVSVYVYDMAPP